MRKIIFAILSVLIFAASAVAGPPAMPPSASLPSGCTNGQIPQYSTSTLQWACADPGASSMVYPDAGVPNSNGSAWGTSYTVGVLANNLLQLNASAKIPAVDGSLLTNVSAADSSKLNGQSASYYQTALTYPVTGVASPTAGNLVKWGASGNTLADSLKIGTFTDGKWCSYSTANGFTCTENVPSSGSVATDAIWDAAGDTVYGTGANTAAKLAKGTAYQIYHMNSGATAPEWTSTLGTAETPLTAGYFTTVSATTWSSNKTSGTAGYMGVYEANSTDTSQIGFMGPASISESVWFQYSNDQPTAGQVMAFSAPTGSGGPSGGKVSAQTWVSPALIDGAHGTPSFTALDMPSSDSDPGTTAGRIKHDSTDTGSSSGGTAKWYDGAQVRQFIDTGTNYSLITKYEYMPIRYAEDDDSVTAPAAAAEIGTTSMIARSFAEDANNGVVFFWQIPGDYVSGMKFRVFFATDTNASANETAVFNLSGCAFGSSGAIACTEGTGAESVLELTTDEDTGELLVSGWSAAITISGTPAPGKIAKLLLIRDVTGGAAEDDMAGHALVTGIEIKYVGKINAFGDY